MNADQWADAFAPTSNGKKTRASRLNHRPLVALVRLDDQIPACGPLLAQAGLIRPWEIVRYFLRHFAGGRPLRAAQERGDEPDALHGRNVVSQRGVEDAALAVLDYHQHGLVLAGPAIARLRVRGRQH